MNNELLSLKEVVLVELPDYPKPATDEDIDTVDYAVAAYLDLEAVAGDIVEVGLLLTRDEIKLATETEMPELKNRLLRGYNVPSEVLLNALDCVRGVEAAVGAGLGLDPMTIIWPRPHFPLVSCLDQSRG